MLKRTLAANDRCRVRRSKGRLTSVLEPFPPALARVVTMLGGLTVLVWGTKKARVTDAGRGSTQMAILHWLWCCGSNSISILERVSY